MKENERQVSSAHCCFCKEEMAAKAIVAQPQEGKAWTGAQQGKSRLVIFPLGWPTHCIICFLYVQLEVLLLLVVEWMELGSAHMPTSWVVYCIHLLCRVCIIQHALLDTSAFLGGL